MTFCKILSLVLGRIGTSVYSILRDAQSDTGATEDK